MLFICCVFLVSGSGMHVAGNDYSGTIKCRNGGKIGPKSGVVPRKLVLLATMPSHKPILSIRVI